MGMIQKSLGDETEKHIADFFQDHGYWAYVTPSRFGGQPFDIIACREDTTWFVDAKHVKENSASFSFSDIEPNQITSMTYAQNFARMRRIGFVIEWERQNGRLFFFAFSRYQRMAQNGCASVKISELQDFGELICEH